MGGKVDKYSELLVAAYNLWSFLRYDAGCMYPKEKPIDNLSNEPFDF